MKIKIILLLSVGLLAGAGCINIKSDDETGVQDIAQKNFQNNVACVGLAQGYRSPDDNELSLLNSCYNQDLHTCIAIIREDDPSGSLYYAMDLIKSESVSDYYLGRSGSTGSMSDVTSLCK